MSSVTDPCTLIATMITGAWATATGGPAPMIDKHWYSEAHPKVLITDGRSKKIRHISLKEIGAPHVVFGELIEQVELAVQLDIWAQSDTDVLQMRDEVKRILRLHANNPAAGIDAVTVTSWLDTSAFDANDNLSRMTANLLLMYEEE
jgi:hypothetical protein